MIRKAIEKLIDKKELTYEEANHVMTEIMCGKTTIVQNATFLAALSAKCAGSGAVDEIAGCAAAMRDYSLKAEPGVDVLEIVGTGGDGSSSFNISTTSAFVAAAAGVKVAKQGNRAESSKSGTADCLEALGAVINLEPDKCRELLNDVGFAYYYVPKYHPSIKYVGEIRRELGSRSVFNILGPLTNPADPAYYLLGVYSEHLVEPVAKALVRLGTKRGLVVYGRDRLDEISMSAPTAVCEIRDGYYRSYVITPEDFGMRRCSREELVGGTPEVNASITRAILNGTEKGAKRNVVLLNAGAAIYAAGAAESIEDGIRIASECIDSKEALNRMEEFIRRSCQ